MLTLFSTPKPFRGPFATIQTNAIRSWTLLRPKPETILLGNDEGVAEIATQLGLIHIPDIDRNEYGTPLVNSIFSRAQLAASNDLMCYVNADIILMNCFIEAVQKVVHLMAESAFLMIGRKTSIELTHLLDFGRSDWDVELKERAKARGFYGTTDTDYFVFPRGLWQDIPPFAIGRFFWSAWLVYSARRRNVPVIDATPVVMALEPAHDYSHMVSSGGAKRPSGIEIKTNRRLFGRSKYFSTMDATHVLTHSGLSPRPVSYIARSLLIRLDIWIGFLAKESFYPFSLPLFAFYKATRPFWLLLRRALLNRV